MSTTKKIILFAIILACIYAAYLMAKSGEPISETIKKAVKTKKAIDDTLPGNPNKQLKMDSRGVEVEYLQNYLNRVYNSGLKEDGILGEKTFAALAKNNIELPTTLNELPKMA